MVKFDSTVIHSGWEHLGCRVCRFGDSTRPPVTRETFLGRVSVLFGEPHGGTDWRLSVPGITVTDAESPYDHLPKKEKEKIHCTVEPTTPNTNHTKCGGVLLVRGTQLLSGSARGFCPRH